VLNTLIIVKVDFTPPKNGKLASTVNWPMPWGLRPDSVELMAYDANKLPASQLEYDNFTFIDKPHYGIYCWAEYVLFL
jgi:hypothetical protein